MFFRKINSALEEWAVGPNRKPLVLRGARQVGKTTAVRNFSKGYATYIGLNLELAADRKLFETDASAAEVWEAIRFVKNIPRQDTGKTLLFIDEIQKSPRAVALLRYFHEDLPDLHVIAAGSLLESMLDVHISFPVGRVEFLLLHPMTFEEFLGALGETQALEAMRTLPVPAYAHDKLTNLFRKFLLVGGMPEAVRTYAESNDLGSVDHVHESLLVAYQEDVEKYGTTQRLVPIIRHALQSAFHEAAGRIRYEGFGNSNYPSRDIKEALGILQKAFLFQVVHPVTSTSLPMSPDVRKSPRLHALDTGLVVHRTGMRKALFTAEDVSAVYSGRIVEHIVGQELYAMSHSPLHTLNFWARDKNQSNAEVDYVLPVEGRLIPMEVKAGATGRLRSLHAFLDAATHSIGVRLYGGPYRVEKGATLAGKAFTLINLPWYLASKSAEYVERVSLDPS